MGDIIRLVQKIMAPLARRVRLMVGRGIITLVDDGLKEQALQVSLLADEVRDDVERYQEYGFTSHPHVGAEAVLVFAGGNRDHGLVIATGDRRYRLTGLASGEVALYTDEGDYIKLSRGRVIEVETETLLVRAATTVKTTSPLVEDETDNVLVKASVKVRMETPLLEVTGEIRDRCDIGGLTMDSMRTIYNSHTHPENDNGGPTDAPNQAME